MEERRLRTDDSPSRYLHEQLEATIFQIQPYHWPIIGWMEDLKRLTLEDLKAYYKTYYNPTNAFLVVVGDFKKEDLLPRIEKAFGSIPKGIPPEQKKPLDPPQTGERRVSVNKEAQLPIWPWDTAFQTSKNRIVMSWRSLPRFSPAAKARDYTRASCGKSALPLARMQTIPFSPKTLPSSISTPILFREKRFQKRRRL